MRKILFKSTEVCQILGLSANTTRNLTYLIKTGRIPKPDTKIKGKSYWTIETIEKWLKDNGIKINLEKYLND